MDHWVAIKALDQSKVVWSCGSLSSHWGSLLIKGYLELWVVEQLLRLSIDWRSFRDMGYEATIKTLNQSKVVQSRVHWMAWIFDGLLRDHWDSRMIKGHLKPCGFEWLLRHLTDQRLFGAMGYLAVIEALNRSKVVWSHGPLSGHLSSQPIKVHLESWVLDGLNLWWAAKELLRISTN